MLEIPESKTVSRQVTDTLAGKQIAEIFSATSPHKFMFHCGDPAAYTALLKGRQILSAKGHGMFVDIFCDKDTCITISDGTNIRYHKPYEQRPEKYQLLIILDDGSFVPFTIAMYGGLWIYRGTLDNSYHQGSLNSISPLDDAFDISLFVKILNRITKDISVKAMLATEQRIPGIGNGVLQDILFNAGIHPKQKKSTLTDFQQGELFHSLKTTLTKMTDKGGRDTEKDLFGNFGGYHTILSKNTLKNPCPNCGNAIVKEQYMGGAIYFCPVCQKI
ncbi:MAG: endonuclease VIII [Bacteroidales bacterium]|nr:endonuclease VIII [Bacteroidales bacterium]